MKLPRSTQVENGKAFEFAVAKSFSELLDVQILASPSSKNAQESYKKVDEALRLRFDDASKKSARHIIEKEEILRNEATSIWLASDSLGQDGDVRDVIVNCGDKKIGFSCKTNHAAFKHSRLSGKADFIKSWGINDLGCSNDYWNKVKPIFTELSIIRKESAATALWKIEPDVANRFYWPILDAFESEINRLSQDPSTQAETASRLVSYIVGFQDFYKIVVRKDVVELQAFNLGGTLSVTKTRLPNQIIGIDRLNGGQYSKTIRLNRGFTFNFRIHSASSRIEPSLKFDVTAISLPPSEIYTNHIMLDY